MGLQQPAGPTYVLQCLFDAAPGLGGKGALIPASGITFDDGMQLLETLKWLIEQPIEDDEETPKHTVLCDYLDYFISLLKSGLETHNGCSFKGRQRRIR
jgi:hypothetical protein